MAFTGSAPVFYFQGFPVLMNGGTVLPTMCGICDPASPPPLRLSSFLGHSNSVCIHNIYISDCDELMKIAPYFETVVFDISHWLLVLAKGSNFVHAD